jgi:DNA invertase Pin-like site-specific DNA recombinase
MLELPGKKRTKLEIEQELNRIYKLIVDGLSYIEIREKLGIKESTFYWYLDKSHGRIVTREL